MLLVPAGGIFFFRRINEISYRVATSVDANLLIAQREREGFNLLRGFAFGGSGNEGSSFSA